MRSGVYTVLFCFIVFLFHGNVVADSVETKNSFDEGTVKELKEDPRLSYPVGIDIEEESWFRRLLAWIGRWFKNMFSIDLPETQIGGYFLRIVAIGLLIFLAYILYKSTFQKLFARSEGSSFDYEAKIEDIHEIDYKTEIEEALVQRNFLKAIRLYYLYCLKLLDQHQAIEYKHWKTNHDYFYEIKDREVKSNFTQLTDYFDFIWYGHFKATEQAVSEVEGIFSSIQGKLNSGS